jgi:uncharacterized protein YdbL (DUF1318 family)
MYMSGILSLGQEDYAKAAQDFASAQDFGSNLWSFQAALDAVRRDLGKLDAAIASHPGPATQGEDLGAWNFAISVAADRGDWVTVSHVLRQAQADPGSNRPRGLRQLRLIEASLAGLRAPAGKHGDTTATLVPEEAAAMAKESAVDRAETVFRVLLAGYLAANGGDARTAEAAVARAGPESRSTDYPVLARMLAVTRAEIARIGGKPQDAIHILLAEPLDGTELCLTHAALLDAYEAAGDHKSALEHARWLTQRRGRAYTEYNASWIARPLNVALTDVALLRVAELSQATGDPATARSALVKFERAWPDATNDQVIGPRLAKLAIALKASGPAPAGE